MVSELFILRQYLDFDAALRGASRDYKECKHEVEWARLIAAAEVETDPPIDPAEIARTAERAHEIAKQARALRQRRDDPLELLPVYNASVHLIETIVRALDHTDVYLENATRDPQPAIQRWLDHINVPDWLAAEGRARFEQSATFLTDGLERELKGLSPVFRTHVGRLFTLLVGLVSMGYDLHLQQTESGSVEGFEERARDITDWLNKGSAPHNILLLTETPVLTQRLRPNKETYIVNLTRSINLDGQESYRLRGDLPLALQPAMEWYATTQRKTTHAPVTLNINYVAPTQQ